GQALAIAAERHTGHCASVLERGVDHLFPGRHVPDAHAALHTGRGDPSAVVTEHHASDHPVVVVELVKRLAVLGVPNPYDLVKARRGETLTIGTDRPAAHRLRVAAAPADYLPGGRVPDDHRVVPAGRGEAPAVGAERHTVATVAEGVKFLAGPGVPDFHFQKLHPLAADGGQALAVGAEHHAGNAAVVAAQGQGVVAGLLLQGRGVPDPDCP